MKLAPAALNDGEATSNRSTIPCLPSPGTCRALASNILPHGACGCLRIYIGHMDRIATLIIYLGHFSPMPRRGLIACWRCAGNRDSNRYHVRLNRLDTFV
jgi:hypothetical protein